MVNDGVSYVHIQGIDNILTKSADPLLTGYVIKNGLDLCFKTVLKTDPAENIGIHVKRNEAYTVYGYLIRICEHEQ